MSKHPLKSLNSLCCHLVVIFLGKHKKGCLPSVLEKCIISVIYSRKHKQHFKKAPIITLFGFQCFNRYFVQLRITSWQYYVYYDWLLLLAWPQISAVCATVHFKKKTNRQYKSSLPYCTRLTQSVSPRDLFGSLSCPFLSVWSKHEGKINLKEWRMFLKQILARESIYYLFCQALFSGTLIPN